MTLSDFERLQLHQLKIVEWAGASAEADETTASTAPIEELPDRWEMARGIKLHDWQQACIETWFAKGRRGTAKVVTGGGKTLLALAIAERLQNSLDPELRVAVVVPTVVLLNQWYDEILSRSNLPARWVGRLGGGHKDSFADRRILICVLASAQEKLHALVNDTVAPHLLLVADECHRMGAQKARTLLELKRAYSLGLSATPERDDADDDAPNDDSPSDETLDAAYDTSPLGLALGPIIADFTLADAVRLEVIPKFEISHFGLDLTQAEQARYDKLSREVSELWTQMQEAARGGRRRGQGGIIAAARKNAPEIAAQFQGRTSARKRLLYATESRARAVQQILTKEFERQPDARAILFHESIDEVMSLFARLRAAGLPVIAEHSQLPDALRDAGLELFRRGIARVIVSARSLIEGFNVPATDIGIVVASSGSVRQRIQSLGRVLRRHRGSDGEEKVSRIYVLYARGTVDERLYEQVDWERITGLERNAYFDWSTGHEPVKKDGPPRRKKPADHELDETSLEEGARYPGESEGDEFTCDRLGNVRRLDGAVVSNAPDLGQKVVAVRGRPGRFLVTSRRHHVITTADIEGSREWVYITKLARRLETASEQGPAAAVPERATWLAGAKPGDPYPFPDVAILEDSLQFKKKQGGVIARKMRGGELFARTAKTATDPQKGAAAERAIAAIVALQASGLELHKFELNASGDLVFRMNGKIHYISTAPHGFEFPGQE